MCLKDGYTVSPETLENIYKKCQHELPVYARPLFLRFQEDFTVTQTMKHRKIELIDEGFDPTKITDKLFYRNSSLQTYSPLTVSSYEGVLQSKL